MTFCYGVPLVVADTIGFTTQSMSLFCVTQLREVEAKSSACCHENDPPSDPINFDILQAVLHGDPFTVLQALGQEPKKTGNGKVQANIRTNNSEQFEKPHMEM